MFGTFESVRYVKKNKQTYRAHLKLFKTLIRACRGIRHGSVHSNLLGTIKYRAHTNMFGTY